MDHSKIIKKLSGSDPAALKELYDFYAADIYRFAFSILKTQVDAEEVTQSVFIKIWEVRKSLMEDRNFKSFIFTVTRNASLNYLRKRFNERVMTDNLEKRLSGITPAIQDDIVIEKEMQGKASKLIDMLPPKRKRIFLLSRFKGMTYQEIADFLNISENTVDTQMRKAIKFMKDNLSDEISFILLLFFINSL